MIWNWNLERCLDPKCLFTSPCECMIHCFLSNTIVVGTTCDIQISLKPSFSFRVLEKRLDHGLLGVPEHSSNIPNSKIWMNHNKFWLLMINCLPKKILVYYCSETFVAQMQFRPDISTALQDSGNCEVSIMKILLKSAKIESESNES